MIIMVDSYSISFYFDVRMNCWNQSYIYTFTQRVVFCSETMLGNRKENWIVPMQ